MAPASVAMIAGTTHELDPVLIGATVPITIGEIVGVTIPL